MTYTLDTIRLLIAHDSQDDAEQLMNAMRNAGRATRAELVLGEDDLLRALKSGSWELLLCRPAFGGCTLEQAMAHMQRLGKAVPTIGLVDNFDEQTLLESMKAGARAIAPAGNRELIMLLVDQQLQHLQLRKERQQIDLALRDAEKRLAVLMDQSRDAIAYVVDGMHIHANDTYLDMFGYASSDDLAGVPIMDMVSAADHEKLKKLLRSRAQDESQTNELECRGVTTGADEFDATFVFSPSTYDGEACTQIVIRSAAVDESVLQEKLDEMSRTDQVTGLNNRGWFMEQLDAALGSAVKNGQMSAVLYLRVDHFEQHQSAVGIEGADEALRHVADALREALGESLPMARVGDEDFALLLPVGERNDAAGQAEVLRAAIETLMPPVQGRTLHMTASVGVAFVQEDSRNGQAVITKALDCCNKAQKKNDQQGNSVHVHDPMDDVAAGSSEAIALSIRQALEQGSFRLLYQPMMNMSDEGDHLFEVFVHLPQKNGDDLTPDAFMPVAAEHGLAGKIDRWVTLHAMRAAAELKTRVKLMINLSGHSLQEPDLAPWIGKAIKAAKFDGSRLFFQLTEADANSFLKQAQTFVEQISVLGCRMSISRFAGGINPFKLFEHIPAAMVKFDGSFTQELGKPESKQKFADLINTAAGQGKLVIVGFVESAQQMQVLWTMNGIHYLQGYYLQAPGASLQVSQEE
ncbi:MAG: EAL domain-containing protein [Alcanivorax sp.]|nr:EAL domain-containing protein [Alcanivorax sp.]